MTYSIELSLLPLITCLNLDFMSKHQNVSSICKFSLAIITINKLKNSVSGIIFLFQMILLVDNSKH